MKDPYLLQRFVEAQAPVFEQVRAELQAGCKRSHWMWFIFPQVAGLGQSETARRFAISSLDEAAAYLRHPILGPRLRQCTALVNSIDADDIAGIFGAPDDLKFHSSMTLFGIAAHDAQDVDLFAAAISKYFDGEPDCGTLARLKTGSTIC